MLFENLKKPIYGRHTYIKSYFKLIIFILIDTEAIIVSNKDNKKLTYTKDMLIKNIAEKCGEDNKTIRLFYNALEDNIADILSSAEPGTDMVIRLFEGITINTTYVPEKSKVNNLTGEPIIAKSKIKPKANITRYYCDKLTNRGK